MLTSVLSSFDLSSVEFPAWSDIAGSTLPKSDENLLDDLLVCEIIDQCPDLELADRLASGAIDLLRRTNNWSKHWSIGQSPRTPLGDLYVFADSLRGHLINSGRFKKFGYIKTDFAQPIAIQWWGKIREGSHATRNKRT